MTTIRRALLALVLAAPVTAFAADAPYRLRPDLDIRVFACTPDPKPLAFSSRAEIDAGLKNMARHCVPDQFDSYRAAFLKGLEREAIGWDKESLVVVQDWYGTGMARATLELEPKGTDVVRAAIRWKVPPPPVTADTMVVRYAFTVPRPPVNRIEVTGRSSEVVVLRLGISAPKFDEQFWTVYGFPLNDSTLASVHARLGTAPIFAVPDEHHEHASCYTTADASTVAVFSTGELGAGKQLLGVSLERPALHHYACVTPKVPLAAEFPFGLRLGMTEEEFLQKAVVPFAREVPFEADGGELRRQVTLNRAITEAEALKRYGDPTLAKELAAGEGMDVSQQFWVTLDKGKVVAMGVWKEETF